MPKTQLLAYGVALAFGLALSGCLVDEKPKEEDDSATNTVVDTADQVIQEEEDDLSTAPIRRIIETRRMRRDTLPMAAAQLEAIVPAEAIGFKRTAVKSETVVLPERGLSMVTIDFELARGNQTVVGSITDLNGAQDLLISMWKAHNRETDYNSNKEINKSMRLSAKLVGYENVKKVSKRAIVSVLVDNRFTVTLEGQGFESADPLKQYIKAMDLDRLFQSSRASK